MDSLDEVAHRPWPLPRGPWRLRMRWEDLLFLHWPVEPEVVRPLVPEGLAIDVRDGRAWVGVIPFRMREVRVRGLPALPGAGAFEELNVRTYVTDGERPGVWFFSLDAASRAAVVAARRWFGLEYRHARMECGEADGWMAYRSRRRDGGAAFEARWRMSGEPRCAAPSSLEAWLTERYCLYALRAGTLVRGEIHHRPWALAAAEVDVDRVDVAAAAGIPLSDAAPHARAAAPLDVVAWGPERV